MAGIREVHITEKMEVTVPANVESLDLRKLGERLVVLANEGWRFVRADPDVAFNQRDGEYANGGVVLKLERRNAL